MSLRGGDPAEIGGYPLEARLGSGGMGTVFLARTSSGRPVAIKLIHQQFAADDEFRIRFRQEVAAARQVSGAFTAAVVDAAPEAEQPWMATTYIEGHTLAQRIATKGPLNGAELRRLAIGLAEALRDIHRVGVVHRDLKPSNVVLSPEGPRVIDFGISRAVDQQTLTMTGRVIGTPPFMSPEQLQAPRDVGPRSDVFSLGTLLVYSATGHGPFDAESPYMTAYQVVHEEPSLEDVPAALRAVVESCLAKEPDGRPSADELLVLLRDLPADLGADRREWSWRGPHPRHGHPASLRDAGHLGAGYPGAGHPDAGHPGAGDPDHHPGRSRYGERRHPHRPPTASPLASRARGRGRGHGGSDRWRSRRTEGGRLRGQQRRRQGQQPCGAGCRTSGRLQAVAQGRAGRSRGHPRRAALRRARRRAVLRGRRCRRDPYQGQGRLAGVDGEEPRRPRQGHAPGGRHRRHGARLPLRRPGRPAGPSQRGGGHRREQRPGAVVRAVRRPVDGRHGPDSGRHRGRLRRRDGRRFQLPLRGPERAQR